jgi:hypothetical protein
MFNLFLGKLNTLRLTDWSRASEWFEPLSSLLRTDLLDGTSNYGVFSIYYF